MPFFTPLLAMTAEKNGWTRRIKAGAYPKAKIEDAVADFVKSVMQLDEADKDFIERFQSGEYCPELLFGTQMKHLEHHPVALATLSKVKKYDKI